MFAPRCLLPLARWRQLACFGVCLLFQHVLRVSRLHLLLELLVESPIQRLKHGRQVARDKYRGSVCLGLELSLQTIILMALVIVQQQYALLLSTRCGPAANVEATYPHVALRSVAPRGLLGSTFGVRRAYRLYVPLFSSVYAGSKKVSHSQWILHIWT